MSKEVVVFKSDTNKYLRVEKDVVLNQWLDAVIVSLDKVYERYNLTRMVTSGIRTPQRQLGIIIEYANNLCIPANFREMDVDVRGPDGNYIWQSTWSHLLNQKIIINPPRPAICLEDYYDAEGNNKKGLVINPSVHSFGLAFDTQGNTEHSSIDELDRMYRQEKVNFILYGIRSYRVERRQNCLHTTIISKVVA